MSGGGGSGSDGGNDMQVSGAEAAYSSEKGISTHADTQVSDRSFSGGGDGPSYGYGEGKVDPGFQQANTSPRADTSTVGIAAPDTNYSESEIEKGYTDEGQILANVNGKYMTKQQMYNTGIIEKDPETGQDVQGRYTVNPNTGEIEKANKTFAEHWNDAPEAIKVSPTLRLLYASGKNINEWLAARNFKGFNEAGQRGKLGNAALGYGQSTSKGLLDITTPEGEREAMNQLAAEAPYLVSKIQKPDSVAGNWYANLGSTGSNQFFFSKGYAEAKTKQHSILGNPTAMRYLAVNESPFYDWLKTNSLNKGIL